MVSVEQVAVEAEVPHAPGRAIKLSTRKPVLFKGTATNVWASVIVEHTSENGEVTLRKGARFIPSHSRGESVVGTAVIEAGDVLEGEYKHPDIFVRGISVPCAKLSLTPPFLSLKEEEAVLENLKEDEQASEEGERVYLLRHERFRVPLRERPSFSSRARVVQSPHCNNCLQFVGHARRGRWLEVSAGGPAVWIKGWLPIGWLKEDPEGLIYGGGCTGDHDAFAMGGHGWGQGSPPEDLYIGEAVIEAGTQVFAEPGRGLWATVKEKLTVQVWHKRGSAWVALRNLPGIRDAAGGWPLDAFVPRRSVQLLKGTSSSQ